MVSDQKSIEPKYINNLQLCVQSINNRFGKKEIDFKFSANNVQ